MPHKRCKPSRNGRNGKSPRRAAPQNVPPRRIPRDPEDAIAALAESGRLGEAARADVRAQRAQGLPITYKRGNEIVVEHPDGRFEVVETLPPPKPFKRPKGVGRIRNSNGTGDYTDDLG